MKFAFGKDYFRELLGRVRSIRANGRRIWRQSTRTGKSLAMYTN